MALNFFSVIPRTPCFGAVYVTDISSNIPINFMTISALSIALQYVALCGYK